MFLLSPKYFLYLSAGNKDQFLINLTSNPRIDAEYLNQEQFDEICLIQPSLPICIAEKVLQKLKGLPSRKLVRSFLSETAQILKESGFTIKVKLDKFKIPELIQDKSILEIPDISPLFWGRNVLGTELPELIKSGGYDLPWDPEDWMQGLFLQNRIQREAAVTVDYLGVPYCRRCGSTEGVIEDNCMFCGNPKCFTCTHCQSMGLSKSCIPLYCQPYPDPVEINGEIHPCLDFDLTPPQQRATEALKQFYMSEQRQFLVWAVCGGGKTEVSFGIVAKALSAGGRVLFAIPRKDIVIELLPRFAKAFPEITINALYGGAGGRYNDCQLTIATTHQCLRFYQGFDLVILDEADAFPYQGSSMLQYAVQRAVKPRGKLVIMTATPDRRMIGNAFSGRIPYVSIPARYHRRPLIVPEWVKVNLKQPETGKGWEVPEKVQQILMWAQKNQRKMLVFLPTIKLIESAGNPLVKWASSQEIRGEITHSKLDNRTQVKEFLLDGKLDFVVTSTIFERGITIPALDVLVLFADYETIYDSRTLIQIAGRVGRKKEPAQVIFMSKTESKAMKDSCHWIGKMNHEGLALGYLDKN